MFAQFTHAIVRPPAPSFADGLTTAALGVPDIALAQRQHAAYCDALRRHGCEVTALPADRRFPDSTFVEDTALIIPHRGAMLSRPGAESRRGEVPAIALALLPWYPDAPQIEGPGTLDAGDVCEAGDHVFIGLSTRTNDAGADQLATWLRGLGMTSSLVDIRGRTDILHLKSGLAALESRRLLAIPALAAHPAFSGYEVIEVPGGEAYGANCVRVNDAVLVSAGQPNLDARLRSLGYALDVLDMSEFRKMDGGLSCLSLRF